MMYAEDFLEGAACVLSASVKKHLEDALRTIETFPEIGSTDMPAPIRERYGERVRKLAVRPFDLIYEYDRDVDTVPVYGFVPFRRAQ